MMGCFGGCAEKIGKEGWTGGHKFDGKLVHIRRHPSNCPVMKKAPRPGLTWKQLNQLLVRKWVLPRTADPTGEVPGRVVMR
jgi:hypothetical protein